VSVHVADLVEDELLTRLSRDVDGTFADLVVAYERAVFTTALRISVRAGDAEDLAAETFLRAYQALRTYSDQRIRQLRPRAWLVTILLNLWRNQARAAARRPTPVALDTVADLPVTAESPEEHAQRHDDDARLGILLTQLPHVQHVAIVLRHIVGMPYAEIADVLGCPEGTAKSHVSRGLRRLRRLMTDSQPEEKP
jgi:RNA polymerase sigma-70 factor (ECF subfamily)